MVFISIFLLSTNLLFAQNISRYYKSLPQDSGTLYFIVPQKGFVNRSLHLNFIYDLTYNSNADSMHINFSYITPDMVRMDSIAWGNNSYMAKSKTHSLFVDQKGSKWIYRYATTFAFADIQQLFNQVNPPTVFLYSHSNPIMLTIGKSKWKKQSAILKKILKLIMYNKNSN